MKILDCEGNFGCLSSGFENFSQNEVVEAIKIAKDAEYGYNSIHKSWIPRIKRTFNDVNADLKVDLAIFRPDIGENIARKGAKNFKFNDFQASLDFLADILPKFAIFQTEVDAIPFMNVADDYAKDGFGQVSKDTVVDQLQKMGYKAHLLVLDEADFGVPIHRDFAFYIAAPKDFTLQQPKPLYTATGRHGRKKYVTVRGAISDLGNLGEYVSYSSDAKNIFQMKMRNPNGKVTHNFMRFKLKSRARKLIPTIQQGSNNETKIPNSRSKGYNRAKWDDIYRCSSPNFYLATDKLGDSIHPIANRPFTIREGCRLHGLPDKLTFDLKTPQKSIAAMIHKSASPAIGELLAILLGAIR